MMVTIPKRIRHGGRKGTAPDSRGMRGAGRGGMEERRSDRASAAFSKEVVLRPWLPGVLLFSLILGGAGLTGCSDNATEAKTPRVIRISDVFFLRGTTFFLADPDSAPPPQIISLRVYLDDRIANNDVELGALDAQTWIDPALRTPAGDAYLGSFHLLQEGVDYRLLNAAGGGTGLLSRPLLELTTALWPEHVLAVAYQELVGTDVVEVGTLDPPASGDTLQLKMIRPAEDGWGTDSRNNVVYSTWAPVRRLELRNVYELRARNIDPASFELRIVQDLAGPGGENSSTITNEFGIETPLLQVLGLDQKSNTDPLDRTPDGRVDPEYVDYERGLLFFPDLRPFDPSLADIEGTDFRPRSWPVPAGEARPDTLGWRVEAGQPVRSPGDVASRETVPEVYDLLPASLAKKAADYHVYTLEVTFRP